MKALILSVRPEHAINILNGTKTLELRKRIPKGFKGWVYCYVTKGKPYLCQWYRKYALVNDYTYEELIKDNSIPLNGTIPFRFWFDTCEIVDFGNLKKLQELKKSTCIIETQDIFDYAKDNNLYAWHIKNLEIFDKPMELGEFYSEKKLINAYKNRAKNFEGFMPMSLELWLKKYNFIDEETLSSCKLTKAPQSYQYVYVKEE